MTSAVAASSDAVGIQPNEGASQVTLPLQLPEPEFGGEWLCRVIGKGTADAWFGRYHNVGDVSVLKVAGETAERALVGADLSRVQYIIGKYHAPIPELVPWLLETHHVTTYPDRDQPDREGFGWYRAELR